VRELVEVPEGIALVVDGVVQDVVRSSNGVGDVHLGRVVNVERGVSAAFLDVGTGENGFLHLSDWPPARRGDTIESHLPLGTEAIVQVTRARVGAKAAALTGSVSLPGRYLVLLPSRESGGVSRRLDVDNRERLHALERRAGCGVVLRTASHDVDDAVVEAELDELLAEWARIEAQAASRPKPGLLRAEQDSRARAERDFGLTVQPARPEITRQLAEAVARSVPLPGGGAVVIEQTEALLAIDVNSGTTREQGEFEATARRTNLEAAAAVARQLRLRDAGGVVVVDFIDMRDAGHQGELETVFREALRQDRSRIEIGGLGPFGLFTLTRRRKG
jgi:ribonuclease E